MLKDHKDERVELAFMRRAPQLKGNISIICENITDSNVSKTEILLLNENVLHSIDGIGLFHNSPLKLLSLSNNCLESLPEEISSLSGLTRLNLDDNKLHSFPSVLFSSDLSSTCSFLETACAYCQTFQTSCLCWRSCSWTSAN